MKALIFNSYSMDKGSALLTISNGKRLKKKRDNLEKESGQMRITDCKK
jgi:hypothetical protein